jgi:hypothetical protein
VTEGTGPGRRERWAKTEPDSGVEDVALLVLEWLGEQGIDAMLRVDAARVCEGRPAWTFAAGGGPLPHGLRADGPTAARCLDLALLRLREAGVTVPL